MVLDKKSITLKNCVIIVVCICPVNHHWLLFPKPNAKYDRVFVGFAGQSWFAIRFLFLLVPNLIF